MITDDDEERAAARILTRLAESGGVAFVSSRGALALAGAAARVLSRKLEAPALAEALADWLIDQVEVADLYVDDDELEALIVAEWISRPSPRASTVARNPVLEAAIIAEPDSLEHALVYGDWLQAEGDLYGELIMHQAAAHGSEATPLQRRKVDDFLADNGARLLGTLAEYIGQAIHLKWQLGFIAEARLAREPEDESGYEGPVLLRWLLEHRSAIVLRSLAIESLLPKRSSQLGEMIAVLAGVAPKGLRELTIGRGDDGDLSLLGPALPHLGKLTVHCDRVRPAPLSFPRLHTLTIDPGWSREAALALLHSELPVLERLTLLGPGRIEQEQWQPLLDGHCFPTLRHLDLQPHFDQVRALVQSRLLSQLETLDLSGSDLDDALVDDLILPNLNRFRGLRSLNLADNALSEEAAAAVEAALAPGVVIIGMQHPNLYDGDDDDGDDDDDEYYEDSME